MSFERTERVESTLTACPAFIFIIPLAPRMRRRRLCLPRVVELPPFFLSYHLAASSRCRPTTPFSPIPPVFREIRVAFRKRSYFLCGWMSNANEFLFLLLFYYRISAYSRILISIRRVVSFESVLRKRFGNSDDRFDTNSFLSINLYEKRFVKRSAFLLSD